MAVTKALVFSFGDGGSPETFSQNCSLNATREFTIDTSFAEGTAPDCDNLDAPSWTLRSPDTNSASFTGGGTMDPVSFRKLSDLQLAGQAVNLRVTLAATLANGGGHYAGSFVVAKCSLSKEGKGYVQCSLDFQSDGEVVWVPAIA